MNFLDHIKESINNPLNRLGLTVNKIVVDLNVLEQLIYHFERLDSETRLNHNKGMVSNEQHLAEAITACYNNGRDAELTILVITKTLNELISKNRGPVYKVKG